MNKSCKTSALPIKASKPNIPSSVKDIQPQEILKPELEDKKQKNGSNNLIEEQMSTKGNCEEDGRTVIKSSIIGQPTSELNPVAKPLTAAPPSSTDYASDPTNTRLRAETVPETEIKETVQRTEPIGDRKDSLGYPETMKNDKKESELTEKSFPNPKDDDDDDDEDPACELARWGLPDTILAQYSEKGITRMFRWQVG